MEPLFSKFHSIKMSCAYKTHLSKLQIKDHQFSSKLVCLEHLSALKPERVALIWEKEVDEGGGKLPLTCLINIK